MKQALLVDDWIIFEKVNKTENPKYEYYIAEHETPDKRVFCFGVNTRFDSDDLWTLWFNGWFDDLVNELSSGV